MRERGKEGEGGGLSSFEDSVDQCTFPFEEFVTEGSILSMVGDLL